MSIAPALPAARSGDTAAGVARRIGARASAIIRDGFGKTGIATVKGRGNVVTAVDFAVEAAVREILLDEYPDVAILSEETASTTRSQEWMWVVDPVDGTKNFSRGIPHFCFTAALCYADEPIVAITVQPLLEDEYLAVRGEGLSINGVAQAPLEASTLRDAVIAIDLGYDVDLGARNLDLAALLWPHVEALRVPGSAALDAAYLAGGRWDLYVHSSLEPWDIAAGLLLVREAGGEITTREGRPATIHDSAVVGGTPAILEEFRAVAGHLPWRP